MGRIFALLALAASSLFAVDGDLVILGLSYRTEINFDFAACIGTTAGLQSDDAGDGSAQPIAVCNDAGNVERPSAGFSASVINAGIRTIVLPTNWDSVKGLDVQIWFVDEDATPTLEVRWEVKTACAAVGASWNASYNAVSSIDSTVATQDFIVLATLTGVAVTNCAANEHMTIHVSRNGAHANDDNVDLIEGINWRATIWVKADID